LLRNMQVAAQRRKIHCSRMGVLPNLRPKQQRQNRALAASLFLTRKNGSGLRRHWPPNPQRFMPLGRADDGCTAAHLFRRSARGARRFPSEAA
jgi:hypothetical protein